MEAKTDFSFIEQRLKSTKSRKRVALVCPHDSHTDEVVVRAVKEGIADFILFSSGQLSTELMKAAYKLHGYETGKSDVAIVQCANADEACTKAVMAVRSHSADVLMKGTVNTDKLLRAVLDKENGILETGKVMSHITVAHIPSYHKLLMFSDAAVIPHPALFQFREIIKYCAHACEKIGIERPKIALTYFTEKASDKFEHGKVYHQIICETEDNPTCIIDGPMDVRTACDAESAAIKNIRSEVAGDADVLIFPNIEAANTFYKTITLFANATTAGWLVGTTAPVVLTSRADSMESKYYSLAMACATV